MRRTPPATLMLYLVCLHVFDPIYQVQLALPPPLFDSDFTCFISPVDRTDIVYGGIDCRCIE